ncbi:hypothetical protein GQ457_02G021760 [Hibiscus cannabinus]
MSEPSEDPHLPKKQQRRDEAPPDITSTNIPAIMDCDNPMLAAPDMNPPSYKDMLTGGCVNDPDDDLISLDDDDIELLDEDVRIWDMDVILFIDFLDRVKDFSVKIMNFTLVLKVLVEPWSVDFSPLQEHPSRIMVWVRLPGLPITWYKRNLIVVIGERIGQVVKIGYQTDYGRCGRFARMEIKVNLRKPLVSKIVINGLLQVVEYEYLLPITLYKRSLIAAIGEIIGQVVKIDYQTNYGRRGRFACMAIKVNLRKPIVNKIVINGLLQVVEYESLPVVCFKCGIYGHNNDLCPCNRRDEDNIPPKVSQDKPKPKKLESFGPWMLVDRKQRRQPRKLIAADTTDNRFPLQQSRYNPIFMDNDNTESIAIQAMVTIPIREQAHDTVSPLSTDQSNVRIQTTHSNSSHVKLKAKGKLPQEVRKPTILNLRSKSVNIMTRKSSSSTASSSHSTKGRLQAASLHSKKHAAIELDPSATPIALVGNSLRKPNINKKSTANPHPAIATDV